MQREEGRRQSGCLFLAKRWCLCVYVDASESSEFFVMLRKALPFLVYIIVVRGEVSVRLEDVIRTISVVKAEQLLQHRAFFFSLSLSSFRNFSENASPKQDGFTPITSKLSSKPLRMKLKKNLLHLFTRLLEIAQDLSNFSHFKGAKIENYSNLLPPFLHFLKLWIKRGIFAWKRRSLWKTSRRD